MFRSITCTSLIALFIAQQAAAQALTTQVTVSGLSSPVMVKSPPGDLQRLMVVQRAGVVRLIKNGVLQGTDFISLAGQVLTNDERGMLDIAFHPNYASNGYFYLRYTNTSGRTTIRRFTRSANPDVADAGSGHLIMVMASTIAFHIGGSIEFGPDSYLYVTVGDSVDLNTPQNPEHPYGKILRIDVNSDDFPGDPDNNYHIPPGNPYAGPAFGADEVWSLGLRNPFRMSFDRATGDMWIGDVQNIGPEEIDYQPAGVSNLNYGWPCMEGFECTTLEKCTCNHPDLTLPVLDYTHKGGACAVTGGRVYRGCAIPGLQGTYFFADFCSGQITSFRYNNGQITEFNDERAEELEPPGTPSINSIVGFGEDALGELYICDMAGGEVFKIIPVNTTPGACDGMPGDTNGDGDVDVDDLIEVLLSWGPCAGCDGDVAPHPSGNGVVNVDDLILVILNWG